MSREHAAAAAKVMDLVGDLNAARAGASAASERQREAEGLLERAEQRAAKARRRAEEAEERARRAAEIGEEDEKRREEAERIAEVRLGLG